MFSLKRCYAIAILFGVGVAGCSPANYVRTVTLAPPRCEVRVCMNPGLEPCKCESTERLGRQLREAGWLRGNE